MKATEHSFRKLKTNKAYKKDEGKKRKVSDLTKILANLKNGEKSEESSNKLPIKKVVIM